MQYQSKTSTISELEILYYITGELDKIKDLEKFEKELRESPELQKMFDEMAEMYALILEYESQALEDTYFKKIDKLERELYENIGVKYGITSRNKLPLHPLNYPSIEKDPLKTDAEKENLQNEIKKISRINAIIEELRKANNFSESLVRAFEGLKKLEPDNPKAKAEYNRFLLNNFFEVLYEGKVAMSDFDEEYDEKEFKKYFLW